MTDPKPAQAVHPVLFDLLPISLRVKHIGIRIRTDKKMNVLIKFALSSLRDQPDVPIILHCFPSPPPPPPPSLAPNAHSAVPQASTSKQEIKSNSIEAVPKLVSIVEVIKREYVRFLSETSSASTASEKGKERAIEPGVVEEGEGEETRQKGKREGLHQYSLLTTFEQLGFETISPPTKEDETAQEAKEKDQEEAELERQELIKMEWLTGKGGKDKRPRMRHTPCMVVVLSTRKVEGLAEAGDFTYQAPLPVPKPPKPQTKRTIEPVSIEEEKGGEKKPKKRRRRGGKKTNTETVGSGGKENVTEGGEIVGMALDPKEDISKEKV
ncbi:hypothetical protein JCM16303_004999 [Sporobolomyces ruberrimus]